MKHQYYVNPFKCFIALTYTVFLFITGAAMLSITRPLPAIIAIALGSVFAVVTLRNGAVIHVNEAGIYKSILGFVTVQWKWGEIHEMGVCGTKVFNIHHTEKVGSLYIYLSRNTLNEQERFDMIFNWPPKDKVYFVYNKKYLKALQMLSEGKIETYNVGNLQL